MGGSPQPGDWVDPVAVYPDRRPPPPRRRRRLLAIGLSVLLLVVAGVVAAALLLPGNGPTLTPDGSPIAVGRHPYAIDEGGGSLWTANLDDGTVSRIDPVTGVVRPISVGGDPSGLAVAGGSVWVWNYQDQVTRIEMATDRVTEVPITGSSPIGGIVAADGLVWLSHPVDGTVTRIDAATGTVTGTPVKVGKKPAGMVFDNGKLYVANTGERSVSILDAVTGESQLTQPLRFSSEILVLIAGRGTVYVATSDLSVPDDRRTTAVTPIDELSLVIGPSRDLGNVYFFAPDGDTSWLVYPVEDEVRAWDLSPLQPTGYTLPGVGRGVEAVLVSGDDLWLARADTNTLERLRIDR